MLALIFLYLPVICSISMCLVVFPRLSSSIARRAQRPVRALPAHHAGFGSIH